MAITKMTTDMLEAHLLAALNKVMTEAAEPLIQQAMRDIETRMRERMAANLIGLIQQNFIMETFGSDIRIVIKQVVDAQQK